MASQKLPPCDPAMGIRRFAGPTTFDWIKMGYTNKWIIIRPLWLPKPSYPKPSFPPGLVLYKPPPRWPKDRTPLLHQTYVNVRLFRGLEGVQEKQRRAVASQRYHQVVERAARFY